MNRVARRSQCSCNLLAYVLLGLVVKFVGGVDGFILQDQITVGLGNYLVAEGPGLLLGNIDWNENLEKAWAGKRTSS